VLGQAIDLLVLAMAAALAVLAYKLGTSRSASNGAGRMFDTEARERTAEKLKTDQEAIQAAARGKDPASALADLGNKRRK
jgi:hypothetical protein